MLNQKILLQEWGRLSKVSQQEKYLIILKIKKRFGGELRSKGGNIGTVGDGKTSNFIKNDVENQGNYYEKKSYKQMKVLILNNFLIFKLVV